jgi:hypothetical protein
MPMEFVKSFAVGGCLSIGVGGPAVAPASDHMQVQRIAETARASLVLKQLSGDNDFPTWGIAVTLSFPVTCVCCPLFETTAVLTKPVVFSISGGVPHPSWAAEDTKSGGTVKP